MDSSDQYKYFIIDDSIYLGQICYIEKSKFSLETKNGSPKLLSVKILGRVGDFIQFKYLKELTKQEAEFLFAMADPKERLDAFLDREALEQALKLTVSSQVTVEVKGEWFQGVIRYIGELNRKIYPNPITATFFGIELKGRGKGKGFCGGWYGFKEHFTCDKDCGIFVPFTKIRPGDPKPPDSPRAPDTTKPPELPNVPPVETLEVADRVTFFMNDDRARSGMVVDLEKEGDRTFVLISPDVNEKTDSADPIRIPLESVMKEELLKPGPEAAVTAVTALDARGAELSVNSMVEVDLGEGKTARGTVRWIGTLPTLSGTRVGLELEEPSGVTDGKFGGQQLFSCPMKMGLFVKPDACWPDPRFRSPGDGGSTLSMALTNKHAERNGVLDCTVEGAVAPISSQQVGTLLGKMRGIQGHCNSCYMDSALFSLFACSSVLDSLLFKATDRQDVAIQTTLLKQIVNPLRRHGFVPSENVMKLRRQLQDGGHSDHTFTTEEKDPEEFLTLIMQRILCLEPLLRLSPGGKVQENYCYQIFLDQNHTLVLPTVQQLLEHSLHSAALTLAEIPACLILQMPRFGKKFKMFDKIVPSLELDITDLLSESPRQCVLCGQLAMWECSDCFTDPTFGRTGFKLFCSPCSEKVHSHPRRTSHHPAPARLPEGYPPGAGRPRPPREKMQLFAALCIETSHYVSFVRHGPARRDWLFFDSMADREGDEDGYNIPQVTECPEVERYLNMSPAELASQAPREMEGVAKRLFCDAYMYLYQSPSMALYR